MDPNATWKLCNEALEAFDYETALEAAENLSEWISKGGFPPTDCPTLTVSGLGWLCRSLRNGIAVSSRSEANGGSPQHNKQTGTGAEVTDQ